MDADGRPPPLAVLDRQRCAPSSNGAMESRPREQTSQSTPPSSPSFPVDENSGFGLLPHQDVSTLCFLSCPPPFPPDRLVLLRHGLPWRAEDAALLAPLEASYRRHRRRDERSRLRCVALPLLAAGGLALHSRSLSPWASSAVLHPAVLFSSVVLPLLWLSADSFSTSFRLLLLAHLLTCALCAAQPTAAVVAFVFAQAALAVAVRPPFPFVFCASSLLALVALTQLLLLPLSPAPSSLLSLSTPLLVRLLHCLAVPLVWYPALLVAYALETSARMWYWLLSALKQRTDLFPFPPQATDAEREAVLFRLFPFLRPGREHEQDAEAMEGVAGGVDYSPVVISGFHRSGTTFLYDELRRLLPSHLSYLSPYALLFFPHLLRYEREQGTQMAMAALDAYWRALGVQDRIMDRAKVSAESPPEEFCFVMWQQWGLPIPPLRALLGGGNGRVFEELSRVNAENAPVFDRLCRKLLHLQRPTHAVVLLKSPFEYGNERELLRRFPRARFIHIQRAPLEVLSSQCVSAYHHCELSRFDPYFWTLLLGYPRLVPVVARLHCALHRLAFGGKGARQRMFRQAALRYLDSAVWAKATYAQLPAEAVHNVRYERLVKEPRAVLEGICRWMGLEAEVDAQQLRDMRAEKRGGKLCDEVEDNREWLRAEFDKRGLAFETED